jgi:Fe-S-cluster containining protein
MMNTQRLCKKCHEDGGGCCRKAEGAISLPVSGADILRIHGATGDWRKYIRKSLLVDYRYSALLNYSGIYGLLMPGGVRYSVKTKNGDCVFLGKGGCSLDVDSRPILCRLAPLRVVGVSNGDVMLSGGMFNEQDCAIIRLSHNNADTIAKSLGLRDERLQSLANVYYNDALNHTSDIVSVEKL